MHVVHGNDDDEAPGLLMHNDLELLTFVAGVAVGTSMFAGTRTVGIDPGVLQLPRLHAGVDN
eukprot:scaffold647800_cov32-Prasinocladus_malaysianus.AAC.1